MKRTIEVLAIATLSVCAISGFSADLSLIQIPTLENDNQNEGRAMTPDGAYVVGPSTGYNWHPTILTETNRSFIYQASSGLSRNVLSSDNAQGIDVGGVAYRTMGGNTEVIVAGMSSGYVTEWMTTDGGATWGVKRRDLTWASNLQPSYNSLGAALGSDIYYIPRWKSGNGQTIFLIQASNTWPATVFTNSAKGITSTDSAQMNATSASGRTVGSRVNNNVRKSYMLTWNNTLTPAPAYLFGLDGTEAGEAYSVSADGNTIFGRSPVSGDTRLHGYKIVNPGVSQTITALPMFGDETGSTTLQTPYGCSADGQYACGMDYRGMEKAALWDTSAADPALWTVTDLTDLARANGLIGEFTGNLRRAFSMGVNGVGDPVVTGRGINAAGEKRAFLITVPKWVAAIGFPRGRAVSFGSDVTFTAITNGMDNLSFQWFKNGVPVTDGSGISGATTRSLSLVNVSCAGGQAGDYNLVVNNLTLSTVVTGSVSRLTVLDPEITLQPVGTTNWAGETVNFSVAATASAEITGYQWRVGGVNLVDGTQPSGAVISGAATPNLTIANVQTNLAGNVTAVVTASCMSTSSVARLVVLPPPSILNVKPTFNGWTVEFTGPQGKTWYLLSSPTLTDPLAAWGVVDGGAAQGTFGTAPVIYTNITSEQRMFYSILAY